MRGFIQVCAALFVVLGAFVMIAGGLAVAAAMTSASSGGAEGLLVAAAVALAGSSIVLVGGGTWVLASIDQRLQAIQAVAVGRAPSPPASTTAPLDKATQPEDDGPPPIGRPSWQR